MLGNEDYKCSNTSGEGMTWSRHTGLSGHISFVRQRHVNKMFICPALLRFQTGPCPYVVLCRLHCRTVKTLIKF